jgi:hypothetical protein
MDDSGQRILTNRNIQGENPRRPGRNIVSIVSKVGF